MGLIVGKIVDVVAKDKTIQLKISEHSGPFKSYGAMILVLDRQASIDLITAVSGSRKKGGHLIGVATSTFKGKTVVMNFK